MNKHFCVCEARFQSEYVPLIGFKKWKARITAAYSCVVRVHSVSKPDTWLLVITSANVLCCYADSILFKTSTTNISKLQLQRTHNTLTRTVLYETFTPSSFFLPYKSLYYPHMPIGKVWIHRLLLVFFCFVFVILRVCTVTDFSAEDKASGVKFCTVVYRRPGQGISHFWELCFPSHREVKFTMGRPTANVMLEMRRSWNMARHVWI